jgi:hypothetical protein
MGEDEVGPEEVKRLVAGVPAIQTACDLDLLVFLYRHPRALLTTEQLAGFAGYHLKNIAQALDALIEAGLLERTAQQSAHAARMFVLLLDGPDRAAARALLGLASTRRGRESILQVLNARAPPTSGGSSEPIVVKCGS